MQATRLWRRTRHNDEAPPRYRAMWGTGLARPDVSLRERALRALTWPRALDRDQRHALHALMVPVAATFLA
jgi:hypothetical protein